MSDSKNIAVLGNFKDPNKIMHAANKVRESDIQILIFILLIQYMD